MSNQKVLIIGLDGADWKVLNPWLKKGKLPNLSNCIKNGVSGTLKSTFPTSSGPAWTSITTGKNPAKHGIAGWLTEGGVTSSKQIKSKKIWNLLSDSGVKCGVVNVPVTYPPEEINGFMVAGMLTPSKESNYTFPSELKKELEDYRIDIDLGKLHKSSKYFKELLNDQYNVTEIRIATIEKLVNKYNPDFLICNVSGIDRVQHMFYDSKECEEYWKFVDQRLENLLAKGDIVFLISDHGFSKAVEKYFHLNTWLEKEGYLDSSGSSFYALGKKMIDKIPTLEKIIPSKIKNKVLVKPYESSKQLSSNEKICGADMGIYISSESYRKKREEIIDKLSDLKNKGIIEQIWRKEEIYDGPYLDQIPDILLGLNHRYSINLNRNSNILSNCNIHIKGDHKFEPDGVFVAFGKEIKEGDLIESSVYDIVPTLLHTFDVPIPNDIDGKVLREIFKGDSEIAKRPIKYQEDTKTEKEKIKSTIDRLRGNL